ncbi:DEAD/DEAH box helicase [Lactococcus hircilactis]|uniref:DEAD/DEAH box helicase n=1 Tax=Lactococcus hircilactis TaxID=1494462 RepID=A0A7X1Z7K5_9LACT|nr:DEAD/DEAH box helicase family protein [Lactococcus hircilactis]MQW39260.1 DEAD/DEAH box helicase [Lactococcus hircilactis]
MPQKKVITKKIELPLLQEIEDFYKDIFRQEDPRRSFGVPQLPEYIRLNLKHDLRAYQESSIRNLNYTQNDSNANSRFNQLLFHMATGSGKTDVMAALMLYMYYEAGMQNFLFVVNTNAVVAKTRENLINSSSPKYLFSQNLMIEGEKLEIREVRRFPNRPEKGVLYLRLTTVQTLANELSSYRENGLTYEELAGQKLVILADEAHHFSAGTKSAGEKKDRAWENVLDHIRQTNPANRQFEFTATIDLQNEAIRNKYANKIVAQYELSRFVRDGYSKKVRYLQANADDEQKMLNAVLLSQYRKHIARENHIADFKPVILFKSNKIDISKATRDHFLELLDGLTVEALRSFIEQSQKSTNSIILKKVYGYFSAKNLAELVVELQRDFNALNTINVNDTASDGILGDLNDLKNLNSLEEADNPFRVIFAVAKLSEGWDVLNLYDIVRISKGAEKATTKTATNSEAQLVGRGARYYPFEYEGEKSFTRRFDASDSDCSVLEYLDYHTINEPKYLENLRKSLDEMDLPVEDDSSFELLSTSVKEKFKKTKVYQSGKLYYNTVEDIPTHDWDSLVKYGVRVAELPEVDLSLSVIEENAGVILGDVQTTTKILKLNAGISKRLLKKAMARNPFYRFNRLRGYLPNLKSIRSFLEDGEWMGAIPELKVTLAEGQTFTSELQLKAVEQYLAYIQRSILMNYKKQRGTNHFIGVPVREIVQDYDKKFSDQVSGQVISQIIRAKDMRGKDWFPHLDAIVDGLEERLIDLIEGYVEQLQKKYEDVYLIRNDERGNGLKLHEFVVDGGHYAGFMPDFVLYLGSFGEIVQVYIEPKGAQLLERDQWKEDLLQSLNTSEVLVEDDNVRLLGVRFYVNGDARGVRDALRNKVM